MECCTKYQTVGNISLKKVLYRIQLYNIKIGVCLINYEKSHRLTTNIKYPSSPQLP